jgi:hypothetical protein
LMVFIGHPVSVFRRLQNDCNCLHPLLFTLLDTTDSDENQVLRMRSLTPLTTQGS